MSQTYDDHLRSIFTDLAGPYGLPKRNLVQPKIVRGVPVDTPGSGSWRHICRLGRLSGVGAWKDGNKGYAQVVDLELLG